LESIGGTGTENNFIFNKKIYLYQKFKAMFTAQRSFYNFMTLANTDDLATNIGNATLKPGDVILWRFTTHAYGTVNAAGNGVDLATA
jgi:hypothetical protein